MTLTELEQTVRAWLDQADVVPTDSRVARHPDKRTLRWYQSLGIVDKPLRYRGRTAIYGRRHALQATAAKLLQASGHSLAQVQAALRGATDAELEAALADAGAVSPDPDSSRSTAVSLDRFRTVELAPGVLVTIDTAQVANPEAVIARLTHLSSGGPA